MPSPGADPSLPGVDSTNPTVERVIRLGRALTARGLPVSMAETIDAVSALEHVDLGSRTVLRESLRVTMVKHPDVHADFDALFEQHFPARLAPSRSKDADTTDDGVIDHLLDDGDLPDLAAALVEEHGGFDGDVRSEKHHVQRVLRAVDLAKLMMLALRDRDDVDNAALRGRLEELKRLIEADVRERIGVDDSEIPENEPDAVDFLRASRVELERMRLVIQPLARRIATRLARRRQHARSGQLDMRRTIRKSLSSGGVPIDVAMRRRKPDRTELFVLCDISGSVADFSLFTLTLMSALSAELRHTRSFVFVDAVDEVTELLARSGHLIEPWQIMRNTNVIGDTGHSDYGRVFQQFWDEVGERDLSMRSTVVIAGDGRCNHRPAGDDVLGKIASRARSTYWLNPEARYEWSLHDSEMDQYGALCTGTFEVRDLQQLAAAVERVL
ncbi:MAG: VWA domain-containing protein [Actinomycetota bacterium]